MNLIQNYQELNILERIIFWGKTIVIILVIVALIVLIIKKRKQNKKQVNNDFEELPIINDKISDIDPPIKEEILYKEELEENDDLNIIENEKNIKEETLEKIEKQEVKQETIAQEEKKYNTSFEIPSAPYQRNVLREMSLSQTSPIGINKKEENHIKIEEFVPKLKENNLIEESKPEINYNQQENINKKEVITLDIQDNLVEEKITEEYQDNDYDIERTKYEIEQEENAIISYKELMEKKDSIQTIDEEEAIISIEELLSKTNNKKETEEETKLYNITEEEENDSFINELKQFRKDL